MRPYGSRPGLVPEVIQSAARATRIACHRCLGYGQDNHHRNSHGAPEQLTDANPWCAVRRAFACAICRSLRQRRHFRHAGTLFDGRATSGRSPQGSSPAMSSTRELWRPCRRFRRKLEMRSDVPGTIAQWIVPTRASPSRAPILVSIQVRKWCGIAATLYLIGQKADAPAVARYARGIEACHRRSRTATLAQGNRGEK